MLIDKRAISLGIFGGSGLYDLEGLSGVQEIKIDTPYGPPSDTIKVGRLGDISLAFLPRHGVGHRLLPSEIPAKANIYAMKQLGIRRIISVSAVGSLREEIKPLDIIIPDQLIDRTQGRSNTFFGEGLVAHVGMADPFCPELSNMLATVSGEKGSDVHRGGTYVVIEGPAFSTRAESNLYRSWDASVIGMTASPEAKLAREAEICFAVLAMVTDYDVWHKEHADVSVDLVVANLAKNARRSQEAIGEVAARLMRNPSCECQSALGEAIATSRNAVPRATYDRLELLISKYWTS